MAEEITLINRGRGLQLSTSRITVADLVPYFRQGCSYDEIMRWIPTLTAPEIALVEAYYREHQEVLDERDRQIERDREKRAHEQRLRFPGPEGTRDERMACLRKKLHDRLPGQNGQGTPRGQ